MTHYQELPQALMKEKHQGQTLTKEEVKVQTAHDLGVENVSKEEAKSMYKTMWDIRNFGSIISVVGKTTVEIIELFECRQKVP